MWISRFDLFKYLNPVIADWLYLTGHIAIKVICVYMTFIYFGCLCKDIAEFVDMCVERVYQRHDSTTLCKWLLYQPQELQRTQLQKTAATPEWLYASKLGNQRTVNRSSRSYAQQAQGEMESISHTPECCAAFLLISCVNDCLSGTGGFPIVPLYSGYCCSCAVDLPVYYSENVCLPRSVVAFRSWGYHTIAKMDQ